MQVGSEKIFFKYPLCITIGEYAFIGAGAVVTRDVPPYAIAYGNPARLEGWMCECCGVKLQIKNCKGICKSCGKRYSKKSSGLKCE